MPEVPSEWRGEDWAAFSNYWLRDAIRYGNKRELLGSLRLLARWRVELGLRSSDSIVRELAAASYLSRLDDVLLPPSRPSELSGRSGRKLTSTMVHGTWGWKGEWWYRVATSTATCETGTASICMTEAWSSDSEGIAARVAL